MQANLHTFERLVRLALGLTALFAAALLFAHPLARLAAGLFGLYALAEAATAKCPLHARLGMSAPGQALQKEMLYLVGLLGIQTLMAYSWWSAGYGKVSSGAFVENIGKTLGNFAAKNPFPWYKNFLESFAIPNSRMFAYAVEWGQIAAALALFAAVVILVASRDEVLRRKFMALSAAALLGGMLMNANFYFAAGWTSASTKGDNLVMFWTQALLLYVWLSSLLPEKSVTAAPRV